MAQAGLNVISKSTLVNFADTKTIPRLFSGTIKDVSDFYKNGYVTVSIDTVNKKDTDKKALLKANILFPAGGGPDYGFFSVPPIDSKCFLIFPDGSLNNPLIFGTWYWMKGETDNSLKVENNNLASVTTKSSGAASVNSGNTNEGSTEVTSNAEQIKTAIKNAATAENGGTPLPEDANYGTFLVNSLTYRDPASPVSDVTINAALTLSPEETRAYVRSFIENDTNSQKTGDQVINELLRPAERNVVSTGKSTNRGSVDENFAARLEAINKDSASKVPTSYMDSMSKMAGDKLSGALLGKAQELFGDKLDKYEEAIQMGIAKLEQLINSLSQVVSVLQVSGFASNQLVVQINSAILSFSSTMQQLTSVIQGGMQGLMSTVLSDAAKMMVDNAAKFAAGQLGDMSAKFQSLSKDFQGAILAKNSFISSVMGSMNELSTAATNFAQIAQAAGAAASVISPDAASRINSAVAGLNKTGDYGAVIQDIIGSSNGIIKPEAVNSFIGTMNKIVTADNSNAFQNMYNVAKAGAIEKYMDDRYKEVEICDASDKGLLDKSKVIAAISSADSSEVDKLYSKIQE